MKVWKRTAPALMLLCAVLSLLVCTEVFFQSWKVSTAPSRSVMGSSPKRPRRFPRASERKPPMISQYTALFESYTQGEIRELVSTLVERYSQSIHSGDDPKNVARMKRARARKQPCTTKELEVRVSELGLGYISDETVLFRYCSGTCEAAVRNYDLSLQSIRGKKKIKKEKVRAKPCCRPLAYDDDISFLDAKNHYHTIKEVSAKDCGCVWRVSRREPKTGCWLHKKIYKLQTIRLHPMETGDHHFEFLPHWIAYIWDMTLLKKVEKWEELEVLCHVQVWP